MPNSPAESTPPAEKAPPKPVAQSEPPAAGANDKTRVDAMLRAAAGLPSARAQTETPAGTPAAARVAPGAAKSTSTPTASVAKGVPKAVAKAPTTLVEAPVDPPINKMRRRITWAAVGGFLTVCFLMFLRFFLPRTLTEPSSVFRIGFPGDYAQGVDTKWQQQYRIWVDKTSDRMFVIFAKCTHLGCTPDWKSSENKFKCPCHGSGYDSEGVNFEGPAPRPMDRAHVEIDATGQIVVDTSRLYKWPKGEVSEFDKEGAYIPL